MRFDQHEIPNPHLGDDLWNAQHLTMITALNTARIAAPSYTFSVMVPPQSETRIATARLAIILVVGIVLMQAFDVISTVVAVRMGLHEGNPLIALLIQSYGWLGLAIAKTAFTAAMCAVTVKLSRGWMALTALGAIAITAGVVISNLSAMGQFS